MAVSRESICELLAARTVAWPEIRSPSKVSRSCVVMQGRSILIIKDLESGRPRSYEVLFALGQSAFDKDGLSFRCVTACSAMRKKT
jgi:hypothetical protein